MMPSNEMPTEQIKEERHFWVEKRKHLQIALLSTNPLMLFGSVFFVGNLSEFFEFVWDLVGGMEVVCCLLGNLAED